MKPVFILFASLALLFGATLATASAQITVNHLRCEGLENPLAIESLHPRLSWQISSSERNIRQIAYQVLVASSPEKLNAGDADLWNPGKVESDQSVWNAYQGREPDSRANCFWKVKVWTNKGESDWSQPAQWSMALLYYKDWSARWIGFDRAFPWDDESFHARLSARYFRKDFDLGEKPIRQARAYVIGLGLYEFSLNGQKVGNDVLEQAPTDYLQNIKYQVYDLTTLLKTGPNAVGVVLGNGRYYTMRQHYKGYKIKNYGYLKLLFQLEVEYTDGSKQRLISDNSWKGTADGPIRWNNEYDGEEYDARKEFAGWDTAGFDDSSWLEPEYVAQPDGRCEAQQNAGMQVLKALKPIAVTARPNGRYILDFGQNMAGWVQLQVKGQKGDTITMRHGEILQPDGSLFTENLRDAQATAHYIIKGEGSANETWEPRFTYFGFRYVEVSGLRAKPQLNDFTAKAVSDLMAGNGEFNCSAPLLNQLYTNAWWGILSNYKGMPVDCPQRNERQPWLGDRPTGCYGENFLFDNAALYRKWLDDMAWSQKPDGSISDVAPAYWRYYSDNMSWCGTFLMVADMLYRQTGNTEPIETHYAAMKKWLAYMEGRYLDQNHILTKDSYGDWCEPPATIDEGRGKSADVKRPSALISTAYYYYYLGLMQQFARLSGHHADAPFFARQAAAVYKAFNLTYYKPEQTGYGNNKLTENLLAVHFKLVPDDKKESVLETIRQTIEQKNGGHLSTGVVGTQWLMRTLTANGMAALALKLAGNTTYPSWGYMVANGATTIWELWNGNTAAPKMNSYNHVMMLGDLLIWYYEDLAGIKSSAGQPGFKQVIMKPEVLNGLDFVEASYQSPYGKIESHWQTKGNNFSWAISIPANSSALVYFPAGAHSSLRESGNALGNTSEIRFVDVENGRAVYELPSGSYAFEMKLTTK